MKTAFIAPFSMDSLRGTPIRAKTIVRARAEASDVHLIAHSAESVKLSAERLHPIGRSGAFTFTKRTLSELRAIHPQILHGFTTLSVVPMLLYKFFVDRSVKIIYEVHGWSWYEQRGSGRIIVRTVFYLIDRLGLRYADAIIVVSNSYREFIAKRTHNPERITVIWDAAEFDQPYEKPAKHEGLIVGYIGGAGWWQGLHFIIGAAKVLAKRRDVHFVIAGFDARDERYFPRLPNISYKGFVERSQVPAFIRGCDVMLSTRVEESSGNLLFPLKLAEYMAAGRPVISSGAGDQVEIIKSAECGLVVTPISARLLAEAIQKVATMSEGEREQWGKNALTFAHRHLLFPTLKDKLTALYETLSEIEYGKS